MSHHFVTVCVVCVLCAAHTPCSAHTEFSTAGQTTHNFANSEKQLRPNEQLQPSWLLIKSKDTQQRDVKKLNLNNLGAYNNGAVEFSNVLDNNSRSKTILLVPITTNEIYTKNKNTEIVKVNENVEIPIIEEELIQRRARGNPNSLEDIEILERLGQIGIMHNDELNAAQFNGDQNPLNRIRAKRNVDIIDEKYFIEKIFEAYGDGTSITMEGFEKLLKKLGLLRLLTDISSVENHNTVTSQNENPLGKLFNLLIKSLLEIHLFNELKNLN